MGSKMGKVYCFFAIFLTVVLLIGLIVLLVIVFKPKTTVNDGDKFVIELQYNELDDEHVR